MTSALDPHAAHQGPCVWGLLTGHFLAEPEAFGASQSQHFLPSSASFQYKERKGWDHGGQRRGYAAVGAGGAWNRFEGPC